MENFKKAWITGFLFTVFVVSMSQIVVSDEVKEFSNNGVTVKIGRTEDTIKGFKAFNVTAVNSADSKRSLNAKIYLGNSTRKEPKGASGECTVYISLDAGETKTEVKQCKEIAESDVWLFEIVKVYNF